MLNRLSLTALATVFCLSTPLTATAQDSDLTANTVVASVNGTEILMGHVIAAVSNLPDQFQSLPDEQLFQGVVTQLVQQELLKQSAGDRGERFVYDLENQERSLAATELLQEIEAGAVTDEALQAAYTARFAEFQADREFNAAHILVASEDEAKALVTELEGGADFAALAREKSTGPSGPNGGDLGWFGMGMMVSEFENAVVNMEVGDISAPVQTQFGWHVIKLNETRLSEAPSFEQVREELALQVADEAIRAQITELESSATIERTEGINPVMIRAQNLITGE